MKYCQNCGAELKENSKFCANCGKEFEVKKEVALHAKEEKAHNDTALIPIIIFGICLIAIVCFFSKKSEIRTNSTDLGNKVQQDREYDEVLCRGDDYVIVKKTNDNYDGYEILVGVLNSNGEWISKLSASNIIADALVRAQNIIEERHLSNKVSDFCRVQYIGEAVFVATVGDTRYFYNVEENIQRRFEATHISNFDQGYMFIYQSDRYNSPFYNMNTKGELTELPCSYDFDVGLSYPKYSDGVFFAENKFFDIHGNVVLDISQYNLYGKEYGEDSTPPYFENGKCTIKFRNNGGTLYKAVIDKQGKFLEEPIKIEEK